MVSATTTVLMNINWFLAGIAAALASCAMAMWYWDVIGWYKHRSLVHNHVKQLLLETKHHIDGDRVLCLNDDYLQPSLGREFTMGAAVGHYFSQLTGMPSKLTSRAIAAAEEPAITSNITADGIPIPIDVRKNNNAGGGGSGDGAYNPNV